MRKGEQQYEPRCRNADDGIPSDSGKRSPSSGRSHAVMAVARADPLSQGGASSVGLRMVVGPAHAHLRNALCFQTNLCRKLAAATTAHNTKLRAGGGNAVSKGS